MNEAKKERRQELMHYQREGMRLARDMCAAMNELMKLVSGDVDGGVEVMVGYVVEMLRALNVTHVTREVVSGLCGRAIASNSIEFEMMDRVTDRVLALQENSHADR